MRARVFSGLFMLLALAFPAHAEDRRREGTPSLDRVLPEIRRNTPGTFYDAEGPFPGPDGSVRYRIKWMTPDGRIIWFDADARTGRVLGGATGGPPPSGGGSHFRGDDNDGYPSDRFGNRGGPPSGYDNGRSGGWDRDRDGGGWDRGDRGDRGRGGDGGRGGDRGRGGSDRGGGGHNRHGG